MQLYQQFELLHGIRAPALLQWLSDDDRTRAEALWARIAALRATL